MHIAFSYIFRMLLGLYGSNEWEGAQIDMIVDCMEDMIKPVGPMITNKNEVEKVNTEV